MCYFTGASCRFASAIPQMKQRSLILFFVLASCLAYGQHAVPPTDTLFIAGNIRKPLRFGLADLDTFPTLQIKDQVIYNHRGEVKDTITGMRGIALKTLLAPVEYVYEKPKELNGLYVVFRASDGYKVVLSWNEIYNTAAGDGFFIVTEMQGKKLKSMEQRIVFISAADLKAGRRYIKGLRSIEVKQAE